MNDKFRKIIDSFGMGFGCLLIVALCLVGLGTVFGAIILTVWSSLTQ